MSDERVRSEQAADPTADDHNLQSRFGHLHYGSLHASGVSRIC